MSTVIWKRDKNVISEGSIINKSDNRNERFRVIGDHPKGEYNLEISNIAESDFGLYLCEYQIQSNAIQISVVLKLAGKTRQHFVIVFPLCVIHSNGISYYVLKITVQYEFISSKIFDG